MLKKEEAEKIRYRFLKNVFNKISRFLKKNFSNLRKRDFCELSLILKKIEDIYPVEYNIKLALRMKKASIEVYPI